MSHAEGQPYRKSYQEIAFSDNNVAAIDVNCPNKYCIHCSSIITIYCPECGTKQLTKIIDITHINDPNNKHIISSSKQNQPIIIQPIHSMANDGANNINLKCSDWRCRRQSHLQCQNCDKYLCSIHARVIRNGEDIHIYCKKCSKKYLRAECGKSTLGIFVLVIAVMCFIMNVYEQKNVS